MCEKCIELSQQEIPLEYFNKAGVLKMNTPVIFRKINFLKQAVKIHGARYCYKDTEYINSKTKVDIICSEHGVFSQKCENHTSRSQGCPYCSGNAKSNTKLFTEQSKALHGDKYNYSKVNYVNAHTKVTIICEEHGEFQQTPFSHINNKSGCPKCSGNIKLSLDEFINKSILIHKNKYNYSLITEYINNSTKVKLLCAHCNSIVEQTPAGHLTGKDPCTCSTPRDKIPTSLYILYDAITNIYKIGISSNIFSRIRKLNSYFSFDCIYNSTTIDRSNALTIEANLHKHFKDKQYTELLDTDIDGKTELFNLEPEDIAYIKSYIMENI